MLEKSEQGNSKRQKLAVDIDGVVCDFAPTICEIISKKYHINFKPDDIVEWNLKTPLFELHEEIKQAQRNPVFLLSLTTINGSRQAIKKLSEKYEIIFVTARPIHCTAPTGLWISRNFGSYPVYHLPGQNGHGTKEKIDFDILIDDSPINAINAYNDGRRVLLYLHPWNRVIANDSRITPVRNWQEILTILDGKR